MGNLHKSRDKETCTYAGGLDRLSQGNVEALANENNKLREKIRELELREQSLREDNVRYSVQFEESPISLWEKDFSGCKKYIEELKKSGVSDFRTYFDKNPEAVHRCASLLRIVDVNKTTLKHHQVRDKQKFLSNAHKCMCEEAYDLFREELIAVADNRLDLETEGIELKGNNEIHHIAIRWAVPPRYRKSLSRVMVSVSDITERKRLETALQESIELYRARFEESPISLWDKDYSRIKKYIDTLSQRGITDFKDHFEKNPEDLEHCATLIGVTDVNETTVKMYGAQDKEDFKNNLHKIFCDETWNCFKQEVLYVADNRNKRQAETVTKKFNGEQNNIVVKWQVPKNYSGDAYSRILFSIVDITEQKCAETSLRKSENKYRKLSQEFNALLDAIPDNLVLLSPDLSIMWANRAASASPAKQDLDIKQLKCYEVCCERPSSCKECPSKDSFISGKEESALVSGADGTFWDIRAYPIKDEAGKVKNVIELAKDITNKIRMEDEAKFIQAKLIHTNKMTSLGTLVSGVAHEVNNPNHYIMSNTQLFTDIWNDALNVLEDYHRRNGEFYLSGFPFSAIRDVAQKLLNGINDGSERIRNIVDNLKNFSRPERSNLDGKVDLNRVTAEARSILAPQIRKYTDNFHMNCKDDLPCVRGSVQQIEQVVINLMMNSLQSLPDKKCGVEISTNRENGHVVIEVKDEGVGIPETIIERITEPFFTTKSSSGGTGLGLSISYAIVKEHKGSLEFKSTPGKGTTQYLKLPVYT